MEINKLFQEWDELLRVEWERILRESPLIQLVMSGHSDRALFAQYLMETFHYTAHNAKNQALVIQRLKDSSPDQIRYMKFCLTHALEEAGHELMALHDLNALGHSFTPHDLPDPLPETQTLIDHIYEVSTTGSPYRRLGYSYWAESSYGYFGSVLQAIAQQMKLTPSMMTFFVAHGSIDEGHFNDIKRVISEQVRSQADFDAIRETMLSTLRATEKMLLGVHRKYQQSRGA